jgi:hypothetical protein
MIIVPPANPNPNPNPNYFVASSSYFIVKYYYSNMKLIVKYLFDAEAK